MAKEYDIAKASETCAACGRPLQGGEVFVAVLHDTGQQFQREDLCEPCWAARPDEAPAAFSSWHGRVPLPEEPARKSVTGAVLIDFFERLADHDEDAKVNFRFVLALMLMRKKLLVYDGCESGEDGREVWTMHLKSDPAPVAVIHPKLGERQIAEVASQLGAIFEEPT